MPIHAIIIGRLGRDPESKTTNGGKTVTALSVACDDGFGDRKTTTWVKVSLWGADGERAMQHLHKGDGVACIGDLVLREWQGDKGKGSAVEMNFGRWEFLPRSAEKELEAGGGQRRQKSTGRDTSRDGEAYDDSEVPF